jgi:PIN domain nuclease of toxin-antitoxin system
MLLDTCALLWLAGDPASLSDRARAAIADAPGLLYVSAISALEIGVKVRKGKLELPMPPEDWWALALRTHDLTEVEVDGDLGLASAALPPIHRDPADRIIVATALAMGLPVLTPDPHIAAYPGVEVHW